MFLGWTRVRSGLHSAGVLLFLAFLLGWSGTGPGWASSIQDVAVADDRIVVRFDERVSGASAFLLAGPDRIAVDVDGVTPGAAARAAGPVRAIRQGMRGNSGARIVFDLVQPAIITAWAFDRDGRTLTLTLDPVNAAKFLAATTAGRMRFLPSVAGEGEASRYKVRMAVPAAAKAPRLPRVDGPDDRPLVVIDAGHGGHDPGAISPHEGGLREKDITLKVAREIREKLLESGRVRVAMTRDSDKFLILQERYGIARRLGAELFISVHCDSAENQDASGATVYTLSEVASDREAARLAARENKADILAGVDLHDASADISSILIDLTQRETMNASASFARLLGRESQPLIPMKANYHRMASLMVLKAPDMPSILFETGYLSNEEDAERLASAKGRRAVAEGVRRAVEVHFARKLAAR